MSNLVAAIFQLVDDILESVANVISGGTVPPNEGTCAVFSQLTPGTTVTVTTTSGSMIGPATFVSFDATTGIVTLREQSSVSPPVVETIQLSCTNIESVTQG